MSHDIDTTTDRREPGRKGLTRRDLMKGAAALGISAAAGPLLAACGSDDAGTTTEQSASASSSPRTGGTLTLGMSGGSTKDTLNPYIAENTIDHSRNTMLHDALVRWDEDYRPKLMLATEITPSSDAKTWTIRVRDDVVFHDGKPMTADDIVYSFKRMLDPKEQSYAGSSLAAVDRAQIRKVDKYTVELGLKYPNAVFMDSLCEVRILMVPQGFDPRNPIGSGPFKYKSFVAGDRCELVANREYWGEGPYVDNYVTIDFPDDTARVNALLSNVVDALVEVPRAQISTMESNAGIKLLRQESGRFDPFSAMVDHKPFSDVRVRQALRLVIDRQVMLDQAVSGYGRLGNDMYGPFDPGYPADIPQRERDVEQAKSLLKQAGYEDLSFELLTAAVETGHVEAAQIFAEQAKQAGVTVTVKKIDVGTLWGDKYLTWPNGPGWYSANTYLSACRFCKAWNEPHWEEPGYWERVDEAFATVDEAKRTEIMHENWQVDYDIGPWDVWAIVNQVDAYTTQVKGAVSDASGVPFNAGFVNELWMA